MQANNNIKLDFKHSQFKRLEEFVTYLTQFIKDMKHISNYESEYAPLHLVHDEEVIEQSSTVSEQLKDVDVLIIVGIGGSNLGTQAIYEAMQSSKMSELKTLLFADTSDSAMLENMRKLLQMLHESGKVIGINVISKSGTTTETLANFYVLYEALRKIEEGTYEQPTPQESEEEDGELESKKDANNNSENPSTDETLEQNSEKGDETSSSQNKEGKDEEKNSQNKDDEGLDDTKKSLALHERIIVTTDKGSKLYIVAKQQGFKILTIPKRVGGRFSVFSNVGLFPLHFAGIDIKELTRGAKEIKSQCLSTTTQNPAIISATALYLAKKRNQHIVNMFLFSTYLKSIGAWYRQLFAESLGKKMNSSNTKEIRSGMMPIYSIGSTDLHSVAQLFLGGPSMTYHQFVTVENSSDITIDQVPNGFEFLLPSIFEKTTDTIMNSIYEGVEKAFVKENIPFDNFHMKQIDEYSIGALLQFKMIEVILLAKLWGVNAFDQPSVELYKQETRKLLEEE